MQWGSSWNTYGNVIAASSNVGMQLPFFMLTHVYRSCVQGSLLWCLGLQNAVLWQL
jgi:hypothetical protein